MVRIIKTIFDKLFGVAPRPPRWTMIHGDGSRTVAHKKRFRAIRRLFPLIILCLVANGQAQERVRGIRTPVTQEGSWSIDIGSITVNEDADTLAHIHTEIYDGDENKSAMVTPIRELRVVSDHRLVGTTFSNGFFDYNFWSTSTVNSGYITVSSGSIFIYASTSAVTDGQAFLMTRRTARFVTGSANEYRAIIRISTEIPATGTNDMRWGTASTDEAGGVIGDGLYFRYSNGAFYVGYRVGGVENNISTSSLNGTVPTIGLNYARYQIVYTNLGATFYVNDVLVHRLTAMQTTLGQTVSFKARAQNYNSGGSASNNVLEAKAINILRLGASETDPVGRYLAVATPSPLKFGPGKLHSIIINGIGLAGSTISVYDSTFTSAGNILAVIDTSKTSIATLEYRVPFNNGLYIVPAGTFGNATVVYE